MLIDNDCVVTLSYQIFSINDLKEEVLIEERSVDDPLEFLYGKGVLLVKVEEQIKGKSFGYQTSLLLHPRDGFGLYRKELATWVSRSNFPTEPPLELGMKFQTQGPDGKVMAVIVKEIQEEKVLIDGNHPLAGLELRFDLKILRVRKASEKEKLTGQVDPTLIQ